jgi:ATP-dependent DNA helicase RecQ
MQGKPIAEQEIGKQLLLETVSYAESSVCRRRLLLHYFGEEYTKDNCEACDNCLHPKDQFEGSEAVVNVLETILAVKEKFKADHIANILSGKVTSAIKSYKHNKLEFFGIGEDKDEKFWNMVIRQALIAKFLTKDIENYGLLKLTEEGMEFIEKPTSFMLAEDHDYADTSDEENAFGAKTAAVDEELFSILKDLRKKISKHKDVPPFVIFQDPSLEDMAIQYPVNLDELQNISGVGAGKAQRYGQEFVEIIKKYVEEKEIIRPLDMVVKSVVNKSGIKVYIIQSIDMKRPLEDVAEAKGLELAEVISEIEAIVNSGTRLNLDYYINTVIDEDRQHDIYSYFREEAESDSLEAAIRELGNEFEEEEIRLMRIKFLSEMGN